MLPIAGGFWRSGADISQKFVIFAVISCDCACRGSCNDDYQEMNLIYNAAVNTMNSFVGIYGKCLREKSRRKFSRFVKGQRGLMEQIREAMASADRSVPTIWFHAASLGEYGIARPLIGELKKRGRCNVVMTFFSPSGYEALRDRHPDIDWLFYLPLDTRRHAREFVETVRPDRAVFMVSEYWPNYLQQLKFHGVPTFLVSAIIRDNSQFFKWYGKTYRNALSTFRHIFVLNNQSRFNLSMLGYNEVTVSGDALFDNASLVARTPWSDAVIGRFARDRKVFIAGSVNDYHDREMVAELIRRNPDVKFIVVPHDVSESEIARVRETVGGTSVLYSQCDDKTDFDGVQTLIVDYMGKLAYLYRYGTWAYVGGGFTPLLHSVIEATVYGLPVSFGPRIERKVTPQQLAECGIGQVVGNADELCEWFESLKNDDQRLEEIRRTAARYVAENRGATDAIITTITEGLWAND